MKRMLLSAIIAVGFHAYLLSADFGWIRKQPSLKPNPQIVTLTLTSRPVPKAEPTPKPSMPSSPPSIKPELKITKPLSPPAPKPKPAPERKPKPQPAPEPEPKPRPAPEPKPKPQPVPEPEPKTQPVPKPEPILEPELKAKPEASRVHVPEIKAAFPPPEMHKPAKVASDSRPVPYSRPEPMTGEEKPELPALLPEPTPLPPAEAKTVDQEPPVSTGPPDASPAPAPIRKAKPRYRSNPPPLYPRLARKRGYQGTVILDVFIDRNGNVEEVNINKTSGHGILDKAAVTAVKDWLFEPGMKGEEKIEMWVKIPIRYQLK